MNIAEATMEAGAATMNAATTGFDTLRGNLDDLIQWAHGIGCWVNNDGTVVWDDKNPKKPDPGPSFSDENRRRTSSSRSSRR